MNLTDGDVLKLMHGDPLVYKDICLVYSPTLGEIATLQLENFYRALSLMLVQRPETNDTQAAALLNALTDFQYLIFLSTMDQGSAEAIQEAFELFCHERITFVMTPPSIVLGDPKEKRIITDENFGDIQYLVRYCCALVDKDEDQIELLPTDSPQVRRLKQQMLEGRRQRAKAKKKAHDGDDSKIVFSDLVASLVIGSNGSITNESVWNLTYYAFQDLLKRMSWREEFDINTRAAMAGAKIDKEKLTHWIKTMSFK